jgi:hypothetical protein
MFKKPYDSEKKKINRWNQLVIGRKSGSGMTRQGERNRQEEL